MKKSRQKISPLILGMLCVVVLNGCGDGSRQSEPQQTESQPKLVVGITKYEPYVYKDVRGDYAGIDVELIKKACERIGYEPILKEIEIGDRYETLTGEKVDCIWSALTMDEWESEFLWAGPYLYAQRVVVVPKNSDINRLEDLEEKRVSVQAAAASESIIVNGVNPDFPRLSQLATFTEVGEVFAALRKGYVDAAIGLEGALQIYMEEYPGEYRCLNMSLRSEPLGVAFRKGADAALVGQLDAALQEMLEDGTTEDIMIQYGLDVEKNLHGGEDDAEND